MYIKKQLFTLNNLIFFRVDAGAITFQIMLWQLILNSISDKPLIFWASRIFSISIITPYPSVTHKWSQRAYFGLRRSKKLLGIRVFNLVVFQTHQNKYHED